MSTGKEIAVFPYNEVKTMALDVVKSGLFPGIKTVEAATTLMMLCQADGIHPVEAMRRYHIIEGRPSKRADAMQAEFQQDGGRIKWLNSTTTECEAIFTHPQYCPDGLTVKVTLDELQKSGVAMAWDNETKSFKLKTNYKKFPRQTFKARVISEGVRAVDPGIIVGIYTPEENDEPDTVDTKPEFKVLEPAHAPAPAETALEKRNRYDALLANCHTLEDLKALTPQKTKDGITKETVGNLTGFDDKETWNSLQLAHWKRIQSEQAEAAAQAALTPEQRIEAFISRVINCATEPAFRELEAEYDKMEADDRIDDALAQQAETLGLVRAT